MLPRITQTIQEALQLSPQQLAFRVGYEVLNRSGLRQRLEPLGQVPDLPETPSYQEWWESLPKGHLLRRWRQDVESGTAAKVLTGLLSADEQQALIERADRAIYGKIRAFSRWEADYGSPIDWHRNPVRDVSWPRDLHWSKVYGFETKGGGDIKMVWEINRFPHVYDLARAYILTGDSRYPRAFFDQLKSWEAANPFRGGANWASGQELAIRSLSWLFGLAVMGANSVIEEADFQRLLRLFYLHGLQIDGQISYARYAVHNNHLIGEALGLLVVGSLFPLFREAARWQNNGLELLLNDCLEQFYDDGGYCQSSHTYHRLALHYLLWTEHFLPERDSERFEPVFERSLIYLHHFQNEEDGRLPNWGANDGARHQTWTACDYGDFRPLLQALAYRVKGGRYFEAGPWDEELYWFYGRQALDSAQVEAVRGSRSFSTSGLHVLRRDPRDFALFRCGTLRDRFGQADQLHVDIWMNGVNIACDPGSYLYNDELSFHRHFMGTSSHNTVTVDEQDQMLLHRRFKWLDWTKATSSLVDGDTVSGRHYGYERLGVSHRRMLRAHSEGWQVVDELDIADEARELRLHWLLAGQNWQLEARGDDFVCVDLARGVHVLVKCPPNTTAELIQPVQDEPSPSPKGWLSRYYGKRKAATSLYFTVSAQNEAVVFSTLFCGEP